MEFDIIRLRLDTPLHLSNVRPNDYGSSERVVHSDTLTAAIFQAWAMLGKTDWIPESEQDSQGFLLSSLFPFHGGREVEPAENRPAVAPIYFLPKPFFRNRPGQQDPIEAGDAKKIKKVKFVDVPHFEAYLHQNALPSAGVSAIRGAYQSEKLMQMSSEEANFLTADVQTRLVKPRDESEPTPYYIERLYFRYNSGLWCLVQYDSDKMRDRVQTALRYLADSGLGTDRAVGNGLFTPAFDKFTINVPESGQFAVNLSLFCPESHDQLTEVLTDQRTRYDVVKRGGWLSEPHNTYRKRSVWMFQEGSLLRYAFQQPGQLGKLVDLQPLDENGKAMISHPVWRDGRALLLPVNL